MIRLSIPVRQALAKLTLPVLFVIAFGTMLLGKVDAVLAEHARMALADRLVPLYALVAAPVNAVRHSVSDIGDLWSLRAENRKLREENSRLRRWQAVALALDSENTTLKGNLNWIPDSAPRYVTARVVADAGGVYARAVLLSTGGAGNAVSRGGIALDAFGLVGRVTEVGRNSARVLLITDMNSRIPVMLEKSHARAMLIGDNAAVPKLMYWPDGMQPIEGERVVTSAEADAFPAGLPVGIVHLEKNGAAVRPFAQLGSLEIVRIFDYGLRQIVPPETAVRPTERRH